MRSIAGALGLFFVSTIAPGDTEAQSGWDSQSYALTFSGGINIPRGELTCRTDHGPSFNLGLETFVSPYLSSVWTGGYHRFGGRDYCGTGDESGLRVWQITWDGRYYLSRRSKRPFLQVGNGYYDLDPGGFEYGFTFGLGWQNVSPWGLTTEWSGAYHLVIEDEYLAQFFTAQLGIGIRL